MVIAFCLGNYLVKAPTGLKRLAICIFGSSNAKAIKATYMGNFDVWSQSMCFNQKASRNHVKKHFETMSDAEKATIKRKRI
jgi:hypothetical protein